MRGDEASDKRRSGPERERRQAADAAAPDAMSPHKPRLPPSAMRKQRVQAGELTSKMNLSASATMASWTIIRHGRDGDALLEIEAERQRGDAIGDQKCRSEGEVAEIERDVELVMLRRSCVAVIAKRGV